MFDPEREWVVEFDCDEAVLRRGSSPGSVSGPDDLGYPPLRIRPLAEVQLRGDPWVKNGETRVLVTDPLEPEGREYCVCGHQSACHAPAGPCEAFDYGHADKPCPCSCFEYVGGAQAEVT